MTDGPKTTDLCQPCPAPDGISFLPGSGADSQPALFDHPSHPAPESQRSRDFIMAIALLVMAFLVRINPLKVQDRLIRLEERMRLSALLTEPLRSRIPELAERQLVALRFASDEELPALVEETLAHNLKGKEI